MEREAASGWKRGPEKGEPEWEAMELEAAPAIFPADGGGSRSPSASMNFLPDLLDGSFLSDDLLPDLSKMEDIFQPAHEDDIQHLLQGPQHEADLDKWLADFMEKDGFTRGLRGVRKRQAFPSRGARTRWAFPSVSKRKPLCFETTRGKICHIRKNNDHWTMKEVINLVEGISKHGVERWKELKRDFFSTSIRTSVHLKD